VAGATTLTDARSDENGTRQRIGATPRWSRGEHRPANVVSSAAASWTLLDLGSAATAAAVRLRTTVTWRSIGVRTVDPRRQHRDVDPSRLP